MKIEGMDFNNIANSILTKSIKSAVIWDHTYNKFSEPYMNSFILVDIIHITSIMIVFEYGNAYLRCTYCGSAYKKILSMQPCYYENEAKCFLQKTFDEYYRASSDNPYFCIPSFVKIHNLNIPLPLKEEVDQLSNLKNELSVLENKSLHLKSKITSLGNVKQYIDHQNKKRKKNNE